ncbi:MAG: SIS domain-containing protein [Hamadaea sp.]|nr:SIS domain-containing protein [Hamadaea sp.]
MINQEAYAEVARRAVDRLITTQRDAVAHAGRLVAEALAAGGVLQAYGTGHSRAVALELVGRAGGLIPANQLAIRDLVYYGDSAPAEILDPLLERETGVAERIWKLAEIHPADVFVIASNSGGNAAVVEMAQLARSSGHGVVAITSLAHSTRAATDRPGTPRLADLADVVIDNGAPWGDAGVALPDGAAIGPLSNLTGILAANLLVAEVVGRRLEAGAPPLVFRSANTPGGYEHNAGLLARYGGRVRLGDA